MLFSSDITVDGMVFFGCSESLQTLYDNNLPDHTCFDDPEPLSSSWDTGEFKYKQFFVIFVLLICETDVNSGLVRYIIREGSATVLQPALPLRKRPEFPRGKFSFGTVK